MWRGKWFSHLVAMWVCKKPVFCQWLQCCKILWLIRVIAFSQLGSMTTFEAMTWPQRPHLSCRIRKENSDLWSKGRFSLSMLHRIFLFTGVPHACCYGRMQHENLSFLVFLEICEIPSNRIFLKLCTTSSEVSFILESCPCSCSKNLRFWAGWFQPAQAEGSNP